MCARSGVSLATGLGNYFDFYTGDSGRDHVELSSGAKGEVHDASGCERSAVGHAYHDFAAVRRVAHTEHCAKRKRAMSACHAVFVENFSAAGVAAMELTCIVRRFAVHRLRLCFLKSDECACTQN